MALMPPHAAVILALADVPPADVQWQVAQHSHYVDTRAAELLRTMQLGEIHIETGPDGRLYKFVCEHHSNAWKGITVWVEKGRAPSPPPEPKPADGGAGIVPFSRSGARCCARPFSYCVSGGHERWE